MNTDSDLPDNSLYETTIFKANSPQETWTEKDESRTAENNIIMDVLRRSIREKKHPRRTIYGVLVTNNLRTYKAYSTPYYAAASASDYVLKFNKGKSQTATTQTSKSRRGDTKNTRQYARIEARIKQDKGTQTRAGERVFSRSNSTKRSRSVSSKKTEKMQQSVYYYTQVLTRSRKKRMQRNLRHRT